MPGGTYTTRAKVRSLTGFGTAEVSDADLDVFILFASADVERYTGRVWTGRQTKEFLGRGDGTTAAFFTSLRPVLSGPGGTVTDNSADITVFVGGKPADPSGYSLLGAEGRIEFDEGEEPGEGEAVEASYYYDLAQVEEAATFLAAHYCYLPRAGGEEKAEVFYNRAMEILRQLGRGVRIAKTP